MADIERWSKRGSYLPAWKARARIVAGFLEGCESVLDLGAGTQVLRPLIRGQYIPVDMVSLGPDTVRIDFDQPWQASDLPAADGVAIAGLLEHIRDPRGLIRDLAGVGRVWAVSYMDSQRHPGKPLMALSELERAFADAGMVVTAKAEWMRQRVYRLKRA